MARLPDRDLTLATDRSDMVRRLIRTEILPQEKGGPDRVRDGRTPASLPELAKEDRKQYARGLQNYLAGDYEAAELIFSELARKYLGRPPAGEFSHWQAEAQLGANKWREARKNLLLAARDAGNRFASLSLQALGWMACTEENYNEAEAFFAGFLERFPTDPLLPEVLLLRGDCLFLMKEYGRAAASFQRFLDACPDQPRRERIRFRLGESRYFSKDYAQAAEIFREFARTVPGDTLAPDALFGEAWSLTRQGKAALAGQVFLENADRYPRSPLAEPSIFLAIKSLAEAGLDERALEVFKALETTHPASRFMAGAIFTVGTVHLRSKAHQEALACFKRLTEEYPESRYAPLAIYLAGSAHVALGDLRQAREAYRKASEANTETALIEQSLVRAAWCSYLLADYEAAVGSLRRLILNHPMVPFRDEAGYWLALSYMAAGNNSQAAFLFADLAAGSGPRWAESQLGLGRATFRQEQWAKATAAFELFLLRSPDSPFTREALFGRGESLHRLGESTTSMAVFREYARRFPEGDEMENVLFRLGQIQVEVGEWGAALKAFEELERRFPAGTFVTEGRFLGARSLFQLGEYQKAADGFARTLGEQPRTRRGKEARFYLGEARYRLGQYRQASEDYEQAAALLADEEPELAARARYQIAQCLRELDDKDGYRKAVAFFRQYYSSRELWPELLYQAAGFESTAGWGGAAEGFYRELIAEYPDHRLADDASLRLAESLMARGQLQEAVDQLQKAAARYPDGDAVEEIQFRLGLAEKERGNCRGAMPAFAYVLRHSRGKPFYPEALYQDAVCAMDEGERAKAEAQFDEFIAGSPDHQLISAACLASAGIKLEEGNWRASLPLLQQAVSRGKDETAAAGQLQIGRLYRQTGEMDRAVIEFLKVPYLFPGIASLHMEARLEAAATYAGMGRVREARSLLRFIIASPDAGDYATKAAEFLSELGTTKE